MQIRVCDCCGEQLEGGNYGLLTLIKDTKAVYDGVELCELCCDKVVRSITLRWNRPAEEALAAGPVLAVSTTRRSPQKRGQRRAVVELFKTSPSPKRCSEICDELPEFDRRKLANSICTMKSQGLLKVENGKYSLLQEEAA